MVTWTEKGEIGVGVVFDLMEELQIGWRDERVRLATLMVAKEKFDPE